MAIERIGLVGLGLLGRSIAACLLSRGFHVTAYESDRDKYQGVRQNIERELGELVELAGFESGLLDRWRDRYVEANALDELRDCEFVIESITENVNAKR